VAATNYTSRRGAAADALIASAYLSGTNTRRVRQALGAIFRGAVEKDTLPLCSSERVIGANLREGQKVRTKSCKTAAQARVRLITPQAGDRTLGPQRSRAQHKDSPSDPRDVEDHNWDRYDEKDCPSIFRIKKWRH
jgi:hypothetical protein